MGLVNLIGWIMGLAAIIIIFLYAAAVYWNIIQLQSDYWASPILLLAGLLTFVGVILRATPRKT